MSRLALVIAALICGAPVFALEPDPGTEADHQALRQLKDDLLAAANSQDFDALGDLLNVPFSTTVLTQDHFTDLDAAKAYFDQLFTRPVLQMESVHFEAEADALSTIYTGTFAVTTGTTLETYTLTDGRSFDMQGRWTAVSVQDTDGWKIAAFHDGANFLDNPVFNAVQASVVKTGAIGAGGGLLLGLLAGWFIGRRRPRSA